MDMKDFIVWLGCIIIVGLALTFWISYRHRLPSEQSQPTELPRKDKVLQTRSGPKKVRPPAGAGRFYPADPQKLYQTVAQLLAKKPSVGIGNATIIHVPHAGYVYSGEVAAAAFRELNKNFRRVFILAANHSGEARFSGVSIPPVSHYAIPGAEIALDAVADELLQNPLFIEKPEAHTMYMVEVELPFLHALKGRPETPDFTIVPMILGKLSRDQIQQLATILSTYADDETVFVFSVDLSHFYTAAKAQRLDKRAISGVMSRNRNTLAKASTDGNHVLITMVELAELLELDATHLDYRHSGMVSGDNSRVVGYGAIAFHKPLRIAKETRDKLLQLARQTISEYLDNKTYQEPDPELLATHPILEIPKGVFVTLKKNGNQLRGCIGELIYSDSLYKGIQRCAVKAAVNDRRFKPVGKDELKELSLSISVLEHPRQMRVNSPVEYLKRLRPHEDGVILIHKGRRSTYLPEVWEQIPDPEQFLSSLCLKQGSPASCWQDKETVLYSYRATVFGEENLVH
jgi:hypothetical protein